MNLVLPLKFPRPRGVVAAVEALASSGGLEERGAVFTKAGIVDAILDLCGYTPGAELAGKRLLEPSFGDGEFLLAAISRLVESFKRSGAPKADAAHLLGNAIRGVEIHRETFRATSRKAVATLVDRGFDSGVAEDLVGQWLVCDDFLLAEIEGNFDFVIGNPPYVRQERIPSSLVMEYKRRYATFYDRADLYVLFYEKGLDLLRASAMLGFICANRWIKNKYGGPLRRKVSEGFHLRFFIDLERADAFRSDVMAYPAITVIQRSPARRTFLALGRRETSAGLDVIVAKLMAAERGVLLGEDGGEIAKVTDVACGQAPWILDAPDILTILRNLEHRFKTLEEASTRVGIGVATGADRVFIGNYYDLPVEESRKLPLAMAADCANGVVAWGGRGVVNPYLESGQLAPLDDFPLFASYMEENAEALRKRHTAKKQPNAWYKTIDRIYPQLTGRRKLLIPDIKGEATVAYDEGSCYPHHNLYVVTSDVWNLRALQAVLRSSVALMFVAAYCVRMSGGFLRFQAQYLRRIRCPQWSDLTDTDKGTLVDVATEPDQEAVDSVVLPLFGLAGVEKKAVCAYARGARVMRNGE